MSKILLGNLIRHLITALIAFFVARDMLAEDVARKLYAGETIELWEGAWTISIKQIVDFLLITVVPVLVPVIWGAWARIKDKYKIFIARINQPQTAERLKAEVAEASKVEILQTVLKAPQP